MAKASDFEGKKQDELFYFVEYSPEEAERIGYSNYSYWGSVIQNFLKQKVAVFCLILFLALTVFSFIALAIGNLVDPPATMINSSGDYVVSFLVSRFVDGKDWLTRHQKG